VSSSTSLQELTWIVSQGEVLRFRHPAFEAAVRAVVGYNSDSLIQVRAWRKLGKVPVGVYAYTLALVNLLVPSDRALLTVPKMSNAFDARRTGSTEPTTFSGCKYAIVFDNGFIAITEEQYNPLFANRQGELFKETLRQIQ
jgi:hypothetical protein